ncbi:glycine receptor subunit alpha-3-like [Haemaphysalis longicornis]
MIKNNQRSQGLTIVFLFCSLSLLADLFPPEYADDSIPRHQNGTPITVYVQLEVLEAGSISETEKEFTLGAYIAERWIDWRLRPIAQLSPGGISLPKNLAQRIWQPIITFDNAKSSSVESGSQDIKLLPGSQLMKLARYRFNVHCDIDLTFYPLDIQHCTFSMRSLVDVESTLLLRWIHESQDTRHKGLESIHLHKDIIYDMSFTMDTPLPHRTTEVDGRGVFTVLLANFTFHRELTSKVLKTYLPSSLIVMMSWAGFWIDVGSVAARVILGVTSVLSIITQISQLPEAINLNALDVWLIACELMVLLAVLEFVIAYTVSKTGTRLSDAMKRRRSVDPTEVPGVDDKDGDLSSSIHRLLDEVTGKGGKPKQADIDQISRVLFPATFCLFVLTYWTIIVYFARLT